MRSENTLSWITETRTVFESPSSKHHGSSLQLSYHLYTGILAMLNPIGLIAVPSLSDAVILVQEYSLILISTETNLETASPQFSYQRLSLPKTSPPTGSICAFGYDDRYNTSPKSSIYLTTLSRAVYRVDVGFPSTMQLTLLAKHIDSGPPACLAVCDAFLILPGELNDGEILELIEDGNTVLVESKDMIANWSAAIDFQAVDPENEGHDMLMACCGQEPTGTIRLLRNGIHATRISSSPSEYTGATGLWSCSVPIEAFGDVVFLIISFSSSSRMLAFTKEGLEDVSDLPGFHSEMQTLFASSFKTSGQTGLVQVTSNQVFISYVLAGVGETSNFRLVSSASWSLSRGQIAFAALIEDLIVIITSKPQGLQVLLLENSREEA